MDKNAVFSTERKGYARSEVDAFLTDLNTRHEYELSERDAEIKRLFSENEDLNSRLEQALNAASAAAEELEAFKKQSEAETNRLNARIGEKLSAAEDAAKEMQKRAEAECEEMKRQCRIQLAADVEAARRRADEYCSRARRASEIYVEKQQLIAAGLEQARRHLDDAVRSADAILNEQS